MVNAFQLLKSKNVSVKTDMAIIEIVVRQGAAQNIYGWR